MFFNSEIVLLLVLLERIRFRLLWISGCFQVINCVFLCVSVILWLKVMVMLFFDRLGKFGISIWLDGVSMIMLLLWLFWLILIILNRFMVKVIRLVLLFCFLMFFVSVWVFLLLLEWIFSRWLWFCFSCVFSVLCCLW